jgi:hypothetical protein
MDSISLRKTCPSYDISEGYVSVLTFIMLPLLTAWHVEELLFFFFKVGSVIFMIGGGTSTV